MICLVYKRYTIICSHNPKIFRYISQRDIGMSKKKHFGKCKRRLRINKDIKIDLNSIEAYMEEYIKKFKMGFIRININIYQN